MSWGHFRFSPDAEVLTVELTPELRDRLLTYLEVAGQSALAGIAEHLDARPHHVLNWLELLQQQGLVRSVQVKNRAQWVRVRQEIDTTLVRDEYRPAILRALIGRREMASGLARTLNLPFEEVRETLKAMQQAGEVIGAPLGASTIYALEVREQTRISPERVKELPMSPRAQMLHALTLLPPATTRFPRRPALEPQQAPAPKPAREMKPLLQAARAAKIGVRQARAIAARGRVRTTRTDDTLLVNVEDLRAKKRGLRPAKKQPRKIKRQIVQKAEAAVNAEDGARPASDVARELNVKPGTLLKWLANHDEAMRHCRKHGKHLMVSQAAVQLYLQAVTVTGAPERASEAPEGWLIIWDAVERVGWGYSKLYRMLQDGELRGVRVGGKTYFDPVTLDALKARLDAEFLIPDGWVNVRTLCAELGGLDRASVTSWMTRHGHTGQKYRDPQRQLATYYPPEAATAYRAHRALFPGGVKVNPRIAREIRLAAQPLKEGAVRRRKGEVTQLAERYGISTALVHNILRGSAYPDEAAD